MNIRDQCVNMLSCISLVLAMYLLGFGFLGSRLLNYPKKTLFRSDLFIIPLSFIFCACFAHFLCKIAMKHIQKKSTPFFWVKTVQSSILFYYFNSQFCCVWLRSTQKRNIVSLHIFRVKWTSMKVRTSCLPSFLPYCLPPSLSSFLPSSLPFFFPSFLPLFFFCLLYIIFSLLFFSLLQFSFLIGFFPSFFSSFPFLFVVFSLLLCFSFQFS